MRTGGRSLPRGRRSPRGPLRPGVRAAALRHPRQEPGLLRRTRVVQLGRSSSSRSRSRFSHRRSCSPSRSVVGLVSAPPRGLLHLVFVAGLVAVIVLQALTKADALTGLGALVAAALSACRRLALLASVGGAGVRDRAGGRTGRLPRPLPVQLTGVEARLPGAGAGQDGRRDSRTSVVVIVFDELSTLALMDRRGASTPERFPNFASLARDSTWFRSATTVHPHTEHAVPSILDRKAAEAEQLPMFADHRHNVFTLLGGSYRLDVVEALTHLCPPKLCKRGTEDASLRRCGSDDTGSLASDAGIVYLHLLLPKPYASHVPPISNTWGNFGGSEEDGSRASSRVLRPQHLPFRVADLRRPEADALLPAHAAAPRPVALPSFGQAVRRRRARDPGRAERQWGGRQVADRAGGAAVLPATRLRGRRARAILRRLRATRVYDRALVIVTGRPRRELPSRRAAAEHHARATSRTSRSCRCS